MLVRAERELVIAKLLNELINGASPQNVVVGLFGGRANKVLTGLPTGAPAHQVIATVVLDICLMDRWTSDPSLLEVLLNSLINAGAVDLIAARDRVRTKVDPNLETLGNGWINADLPFFGRAIVRKIVRLLMNSGDKPILRVQGMTKSGKTYTGAWLNFLSSPDRCDFRLVLQKLADDTAAMMKPDTLASALVSKLGRPIDNIPQPKEGHRYEQALSSWILSNVLQTSGRTWIILDGFDNPDLDPTTAALIQILAEEVLTGEFNRRARLVLLDFKRNLAQVDDVQIADETLPDPQNVGAADIEDCLTQHFKDIEQRVTPEFVRGVAAKVVSETQAARAAQVPAPTEPWLKALNVSLYRLRQRDLQRIGRV
jgi:hypothetical protein